MPSIEPAYLDYDQSVDDAANAAELGTASDPESDNANVANKKKKNKLTRVSLVQTISTPRCKRRRRAHPHGRPHTMRHLVFN